MKNFIFFLLVSMLFSCTENDKKLDRETNTYYAKYKFIHEKYDSLGTDKSIELLNEYIEEFPNALNAYSFKAFLQAKANNFSEATETLERFEGTIEENAEAKNYLVSLLLMDTNNLNQIEKILKTQKNDTLQTQQRDYNKFWAAIYKNNMNEASILSNSLIKNDTPSNLQYLRTEFLIKAILNDTLYIDSIKNKMTNNDFINRMDSLAHKKISASHFYKSLSK